MRLKMGRAEQIFKDYPTTEETEVGIHSKHLLDTIDGFNGQTDDTKTVFCGFALNSGKQFFFVSENFGKSWYNFFCEKFFFRRIFGLETILGYYGTGYKLALGI